MSNEFDIFDRLDNIKYILDCFNNEQFKLDRINLLHSNKHHVINNEKINIKRIHRKNYNK